MNPSMWANWPPMPATEAPGFTPPTAAVKPAPATPTAEPRKSKPVLGFARVAS